MKLRSIWLVLITLNMVSPALADDGDPEKPQKHGVRVVNLKGVYADHPAPPGLDPMALLTGGGEPQKSFFKLCRKIDDLAGDESVKSVLFDLSAPFGLNLAQLNEFLRHLEKLDDSGKKTYAWLENASTVQYAVATSCDVVLMADFGTLDMPSGGLPDFLDWWVVLRGALDGRRLHTPGAVTFADRDGGPLDLQRAFGLDDSAEEMSHFLHEAGYLHLAGFFSEKEMAQIESDMDHAMPCYREDDQRSWWATTVDGTRRVVRMQGFDERSAAAADLLRDERLQRIGALSGDGHVHTGLEGNRVEALVKPIGVVEGISDVPWHKDCSLGRHSYECCSLTVGISVTGADRRSGQLRVVAGSHRALIWPALLQRGRHDLPEIDLPTRTGDVTLHLSCTLHMSQPPENRERRVMYTSFRLPGMGGVAIAEARGQIRAIREGAYKTVSQEPGHTEKPS